jgi:hypothetical protein
MAKRRLGLTEIKIQKQIEYLERCILSKNNFCYVDLLDFIILNYQIKYHPFLQ